MSRPGKSGIYKWVHEHRHAVNLYMQRAGDFSYLYDTRACGNILMAVDSEPIDSRGARSTPLLSNCISERLSTAGSIGMQHTDMQDRSVPYNNYLSI